MNIQPLMNVDQMWNGLVVPADVIGWMRHAIHQCCYIYTADACNFIKPKRVYLWTLNNQMIRINLLHIYSLQTVKTHYKHERKLVGQCI